MRSGPHAALASRRRFLDQIAWALAAAPWLSPRLLAGPASNGPLDLKALAPTADSFHDFVTTRMIDGDGLCRSFLCAQTLQPWTNEQLARRDQRKLTDCFQNAPDKAGCLAYENALMATGEFAVSQIARHQVTGEAAAKDRAHRAIRAILAVAEQGRHYMPGYLPKPFGGVARARDSHELSPDQYTKAILALHTWRPLASSEERAAIDRFFVDAADFFVARKFRHAYRHRTIVTALTHQHALGLFVPLVVLAANVSSDPGYRRHLASFDDAIEAAMTNEKLANFNMTSLLIEGFHLAICEGCDDPRLPKLIAVLWDRSAHHVDAAGDGYEGSSPPRKTSQSTRLASAATIVERLHPSIPATQLAVTILGRLTDIQQMLHYRMPGSISVTSVTSWLVAYWRLRQWSTQRL